MKIRVQTVRTTILIIFKSRQSLNPENPGSDNCRYSDALEVSDLTGLTIFEMERINQEE